MLKQDPVPTGPKQATQPIDQDAESIPQRTFLDLDYYSVRSAVGSQNPKRTNEDFFWPNKDVTSFFPDTVECLHVGRLYIVADGVTGGLRGDIASKLAVSTIAQTYYDSLYSDRAKYSTEQEIVDALCAAILRADKVLLEKSQQERRSLGFSDAIHYLQTTVLCVLLRGEQAIVASVGDSRAYAIHHNADASSAEPAELLMDAEGQSTPSFVGSTLKEEHIRVRSCAVGANDLFVLCTDGLYKYLDADNDPGRAGEVIGQLYWDHGKSLGTGEKSDKLSSRLLSVANDPLQGGGFDNITVLVIEPTPIQQSDPRSESEAVRFETLKKRAAWDYAELRRSEPYVLRRLANERRPAPASVRAAPGAPTGPENKIPSGVPLENGEADDDLTKQADDLIDQLTLEFDNNWEIARQMEKLQRKDPQNPDLFERIATVATNLASGVMLLPIGSSEANDALWKTWAWLTDINANPLAQQDATEVEKLLDDLQERIMATVRHLVDAADVAVGDGAPKEAVWNAWSWLAKLDSIPLASDERKWVSNQLRVQAKRLQKLFKGFGQRKVSRFLWGNKSATASWTCGEFEARLSETGTRQRRWTLPWGIGKADGDVQAKATEPSPKPSPRDELPPSAANQSGQTAPTMRMRPPDGQASVGPTFTADLDLNNCTVCGGRILPPHTVCERCSDRHSTSPHEADRQSNEESTRRQKPLAGQRSQSKATKAGPSSARARRIKTVLRWLLLGVIVVFVLLAMCITMTFLLSSWLVERNSAEQTTIPQPTNTLPAPVAVTSTAAEPFPTPAGTHPPLQILGISPTVVSPTLDEAGGRKQLDLLFSVVIDPEMFIKNPTATLVVKTQPPSGLSFVGAQPPPENIPENGMLLEQSLKLENLASTVDIQSWYVVEWPHESNPSYELAVRAELLDGDDHLLAAAEDSEHIEILHSPGLSVTQWITPTLARPTEEIVYHLRIANTGDTWIENLQIAPSPSSGLDRLGTRTWSLERCQDFPLEPGQPCNEEFSIGQAGGAIGIFFPSVQVIGELSDGTVVEATSEETELIIYVPGTVTPSDSESTVDLMDTVPAGRILEPTVICPLPADFPVQVIDTRRRGEAKWYFVQLEHGGAILRGWLPASRVTVDEPLSGGAYP